MGTVTKLRLDQPSESPRPCGAGASFRERSRLTRASALILVALTTACVHQDEAPSLTGPSEFALSVAITATPDSISQDGASQSAIVVLARGPNGAAAQRRAATAGHLGRGRRAGFRHVVGQEHCDGLQLAAPRRSTPPRRHRHRGPADRAASSRSSSRRRARTSRRPSRSTVDIRLVPTGVILPPGQTPTSSFVYTPSSPLVNVPVKFDGSLSCATSNPCTSTSGHCELPVELRGRTTATG